MRQVVGVIDNVMVFGMGVASGDMAFAVRPSIGHRRQAMKSPQRIFPDTAAADLNHDEQDEQEKLIGYEWLIASEASWGTPLELGRESRGGEESLAAAESSDENHALQY